MAGDLFQDTVEEIKRFYKDRDYECGRRFLTCSREVLRGSSKFAFIDYHPGGKTIPTDHPWRSCEKGNAYLHEKWRDNDPGKAPLQIRVQKIFEIFAEELAYQGTREDLMDETPSGYFIPFRSPDSEKEPKYKSETLELAERIWSRMLESVRPEYIICLGKTHTYKKVRKLIPRVHGLCEKPHIDRMPVGWHSSSKAEIVKFGASSNVRLLGLPYSRNGQLGGPGNGKDIERIFERFCGRES